MTANLPLAEILTIFRDHSGLHDIYALRRNGRIRLQSHCRDGAVHVGKYDGSFSAGELEQAAHDALLRYESRGL